jgi:hypothetical protein
VARFSVVVIATSKRPRRRDANYQSLGGCGEVDGEYFTIAGSRRRQVVPELHRRTRCMTVRGMHNGSGPRSACAPGPGPCQSGGSERSEVRSPAFRRFRTDESKLAQRVTPRIDKAHRYAPMIKNVDESPPNGDEALLFGLRTENEPPCCGRVAWNSWQNLETSEIIGFRLKPLQHGNGR